MPAPRHPAAPLARLEAARPHQARAAGLGGDAGGGGRDRLGLGLRLGGLGLRGGRTRGAGARGLALGLLLSLAGGLTGCLAGGGGTGLAGGGGIAGGARAAVAGGGGECRDEVGNEYCMERGVPLSAEDAQYLRDLWLGDLPDEVPGGEDDELIVLDAPEVTLVLTFMDHKEQKKSLPLDTSIEIYQRFLPYFKNN